MADPIDTAGAVDAYLNSPARLGAQARMTMSEAVGGKPDYEAELQKVAKRTGVPVDTVRAFPDDLKKQATLGAYDFDGMAQQFPNTTKFLSDREKAAVGHDDTDTLKSVEEAAKYLFSVPNKSSTLGGDLKASYFRAQSGTAGAMGGVARTVGAPLDFLENYPSVGGNPFRRLSEGFLKIADAEAAQAKKSAGESSTWFGGAVSSGVQSLAQNAPTMLLGLLPGGQAAALTGMATMSAGQTYQKDMAGGTSPNMALLHAISDGVIEAGTELGPLRGLVKNLKAGTPLFTTFLKNAWAENKGEQVATVLQDLNDWGVNDVNKGKSFTDYLKERPEAAAQTAIATLIGAGGNVALMQGVQGAADRLAGVERSAQVADHQAEVLQTLQKTVEASKLLERSPDTLRTYMQEIADEGVPLLYVDSAALIEAGVDMQELARVLPSVAAQLEQAESGGDLVIPTGELLTDSVGSTFAQQLIDHARTSESAMSRAEAKVFMQEQGDQLNAEIEKVMQQRDNDAEFKQGRDQVQAQLLTQLNEVSRFTPTVNQQYATLAANFYAVMAARTGMTVEQFADTYKLGFAGQAGVGGQVLDQTTPAFKNWFGGSKVVDRQGKPLRVYHGTNKNVTEFSLAKAKKSYANNALGFFFTENAETASMYSGESKGSNVMPVYLSLQNPYRMTHGEWATLQDYATPAEVRKFKADKLREGYDGFTNANATQFIAFNPTQIKSATGNNGNYDPTNPNILKQSAAGQNAFGANLAARIAADFEGAVAEYSALEETQGGTVLNTDMARELSPDYRADRSRSAEVHAAASAFIERLFASKLAQPTPADKLPFVLFTAGGTGAGKSTGLDLVPETTTGAEMVFDGTMSKFDSADRRVQQTLDAGREVRYIYTFRDPVEALKNGALPRAMRLGRTAPLSVLEESHTGARQVAEQLAAKYAGNPLVSIQFVDNSRGKGKAQVVALADLPAVSDNGLKEKLNEALDTEFAAGRISETVYRATQARPQDTQRGGTGPEVGGRAEPQRAGGNQSGQVLNQSDTPAFKKWFGDGNMLDESGKPLVLYHGTNKKFTEFKRSKTGAMGGAVYLGDDRSVAEAYDGDGKGKQIIVEVYARGKYLSNMEWTGYINKHGWTGAEAAAQADGWSGVHDTMFESAVAVWNPADIKSATKNNGNFDASNPSILKQPARGQIAFGDDITKQASIVSMLKGADLSTFIHEGGHFFLEVQADLAARIEARVAQGEAVSEGERSISADMNKLLGWMGVKATPEMSALGEWLAMPMEQKRPYHETFARGFEAYAFEGNAPSLDLQKTFQTFRAWLVNVYRALLKSVNASKTDIGQALDVELTPEVRSVMDRMLATSDQIAEAEAARDMGPLFKSAEEAGMTADEYKAYHDQGVQATLDAVDELQAKGLKDMQWLQNARSRKLKELQKQHDALRAEITMQVRGEVMAQPVYRAWTFLTTKGDNQVVPGLTPVDNLDTVQFTGKLRTQVLRDMYGTADDALWRKVSALRMTSDEVGMHPDIVAELFEFGSGDELVKKLVEAEPPKSVIEGMTDQRMLQEHGDLASPAGLERAADMAIHNDARVRFVATELTALQKAMSVREKVPGQRNTVDVLAKAAKDYASTIISRLKVRDVRPGQYTAAEVRSAKAAQKAAGDLAQATLHKRNQLINMYAAKSAYAAQEEVKKAVEYFRKFDKVSKSLDPEYQDQIHALLERFDLRQAVSLKALDKRASLIDWVQKQTDQGLEPDIPPELLQEANRKSFKDMTVEEVRGLRDTIKQIEHIGRLKNKLLLARDQRDFDTVATAMSASIVANGGEVRPLELEGPNKIVDWFAGVKAMHRKLGSLFRQMDGGNDAGPMYDAIGRGMNEKGAAEDVMTEKATKALQDLYAPLLKLKGGISSYRSKIFIPAINASLTRGGRLAVALNWGNEANRQRIMDGDGWSSAQAEAVIRTLTPGELEFVNKVWEYLDSYWPEVAAKEKRLTGLEPEKVQAAPFTAVAVDGTEVRMRGGYYPLKYDANRSDRTAQQDAAEVAKEMMQGAFTRATTRRGHTKARVETVNRAVRKDLNVITQHVSQVVHDLAWHEWLIDTNKLLGDKRVAGAIRDHYGPQVLKTMRDGIMGIATADVVPQTKIDDALLLLRSNVTRATMGASLTTAFLQPFGLTQSMVRIGPKHVLRGLARWGGDAARMESTLEWVRDKSDFMRLRSKTFNKELREIRGSVEGKSKTMQVVDGGLFYMMQKLQMVADVPTWIGQYEKSTAEGLDEAAAVAMADRAVIESQGGGQTKDLAEVQRKHPLLTQFYSYFSVTLNLTIEQTAKTDFKNPRAVAGWLGDMALLSVIPAILPAMLMFLIKGGDEDEPAGWAKRIAEWQIGYLMGAVVGLRELTGALAGFDYAGPPVGRIVGDLGKVGKQAGQGEVDEPAVLALAQLVGTAFGIPIIQVMRSYKGWKAWDEGKEGAGPQSVLFGPPPKD